MPENGEAREKKSEEGRRVEFGGERISKGVNWCGQCGGS
jgi:hypothetical protein